VKFIEIFQAVEGVDDEFFIQVSLLVSQKGLVATPIIDLKVFA